MRTICATIRLFFQKQNISRRGTTQVWMRVTGIAHKPSSRRLYIVAWGVIKPVIVLLLRISLPFIRETDRSEGEKNKERERECESPRQRERDRDGKWKGQGGHHNCRVCFSDADRPGPWGLRQISDSTQTRTYTRIHKLTHAPIHTNTHTHMIFHS